MPTEFLGRTECNVAQLQNAGAKVSTKPEINNALCPAPEVVPLPTQAHLPLVARKVRSDDADGDVACSVMVETEAVAILRGHKPGTGRLIGHVDPCLQIFRH